MVKTWCQERRLPVGEVLPIEKLWKLAQRWYSNRLDLGFHGRSLQEAQAIFADLGLTGPFWNQPAE